MYISRSLVGVTGIFLILVISVNSDPRNWFSPQDHPSNDIQNGSQTPILETLNLTHPHSINTTLKDSQHGHGNESSNLQKDPTPPSSNSTNIHHSNKTQEKQRRGLEGIDLIGGKGIDAYYPIIEKVIVIVGGGILLLIILALIHAATEKGGIFHGFGKSWDDDEEEDIKSQVPPPPQMKSFNSEQGRPGPNGPPPPPFDPRGQLTQRVYTGINNNRW